MNELQVKNVKVFCKKTIKIENKFSYDIYFIENNYYYIRMENNLNIWVNDKNNHSQKFSKYDIDTHSIKFYEYFCSIDESKKLKITKS